MTLKEDLLRLLKEDEEFRYAVAGMIGLQEILRRSEAHDKKFVEILERLGSHDRKFTEILERLDSHDRKFIEILERLDSHDRKFLEIVERLDAHDRKFIEILERLDAHDKKFVEIVERLDAHDRKFVEILERLDRHEAELVKLREDLLNLREDTNKGFRELHNLITALGARWGILAESAFRNAMKSILESRFGVKVERWVHEDKEGFVYGHTAMVEADLTVTDKEHTLIEIKSSIHRSDVLELQKLGQLYEKTRGIKPKLLIVSPFIEEDAEREAALLGIEAYGATS